ncbi:MAG: glycerol-3-phosphate acyltransferase [Cyanobacteria bacterium P01_E01_bin.42]
MDIFLGSAAIFIFCPLLGGLPFVDWITFGLTGKKLAQLGTGNTSVSAAFYHGGTGVGILAALSEAGKGIAAVTIARYFFPGQPTWQLIALIALIMGRYWMGKGAGATNAFWGIVVHDPAAAGLIVLIGGTSFTIFRHRVTGRLVGLGVLAFVLALRRPHNTDYILAAIALAVLLGWIYQKIPDDLDLPASKAKSESQSVFRFFRGDNALLTFNDRLDPLKVGGKAANLALLKRWDYNVPEGWILPAGDDPQPLILSVSPSAENPLIVRSSAVGEDSETASAAGQYLTIGNVNDRIALEAAIIRCQTSYNNLAATNYRRDRGGETTNTAIAVIVQQQIAGVFSGVAFSRDPVDPANEAAIVEAASGGAAQVVSGQVTPEQYRVYLEVGSSESPESSQILIEGEGEIPSGLIQEVARIVRDLEDRFHGIPQDMEWTYDGETLWLLQVRPITTLIPLWTRKIAAEVIPGAIPPLTWSINRPLTCGVWGDIFRIVLGDRDRDLDFTETATLHYSHAYFNATLLGEIFRRMGLPPESLEFLTRGAKFSKPPLLSTLKNVPGLLRLLGRERILKTDFDRDCQKWFTPALNPLKSSPESLNEEELLARIDSILSTLERATYYSILAPLSAAIRQGVFRVSEQDLDNSQLPEVESLRSLAKLAKKTRNLLPLSRLNFDSCPSLFAYLAETPDCESILHQFNEWLERYGYLSQVATDISVPRWQEDPRPMRELFSQYIFYNPDDRQTEGNISPDGVQGWRSRIVQERLNLKGQVSEVYSRLLAKLRQTVLALEKRWLDAGILAGEGDIFFIKLEEIHAVLEEDDLILRSRFPDLVDQRRSRWEKNKRLSQVPYVVYGQTTEGDLPILSNLPPKQTLTGIPASFGIVEGRVKVARSLQAGAEIDGETILVVPYTDAGWSPLLSRAKGIIAEVGGKLSHGAILAREYGIPAVMDVNNAMQYLRDGQFVRLDGQKGIIEILKENS